MRSLGAGGSKPITEVEKLRARVAKLEQVSRNLAKHKNPDEELDGAWHEWEKTFDATKDSIMVIDNEFRIIQANLATSRLMGMPVEQIIGNTCWQVVHGAEKPPKECPLKKALYNKKHEEAELYIPEKDIWLDVSVDPVLDDQDNINRIVYVLRDITERKKAQETMRENEERYRAIVEQAADSVVLVDGETGELLEFNDTAYENLGYTREEFRKLKIPDFEVIESVEEVAKHIEKIIREGKDNFETKQRTKDGRIRDILVSSRAISIGGRDFIQSIWRDITERKKAEQKILKERDKAQKYLDIAGVMLVAIDSEQRVGLINKKGCEILGYKEEEILGKNWFDNFLPERIKGEVRAVFKKVFAGYANASEYYENPILTKNGQERLIAWHNTILGDERGNIVAALSSGEDITERKKAEEALRREHNLLRTVIDNMPDEIYVKDTDSRMILCNRTVAEHQGFSSPDELIGKTDFDLYPAEQAERYRADEQQIMSSGEPKVNYFEICPDKRGGEVWGLNTKLPLWDSEGKIIGIVGIGRDVKQEKKSEEALRESENKYRELANSITDVFFAMDNNLRYTYWNKASEDLTGIKAEDALRKTIFEIFPDTEDTRKAVAVYQDVLKTQQPKSFENEYHIGGKGYFFEINAYPSKDGISVFVKDIAERKCAENLMRAERDLAFAFSSAANLDEALQVSLEAAINTSGMDCGGICLFNEATDNFELVCSKGLSKDFVESERVFHRNSPAGKILLKGMPVYSHHHRLPRREIEYKENLKAVAIVPIKCHSKVLASLNVASHSFDEVPVWSRNALESIAAQIGGTVARLKAEEALRESREYLVSLTNSMWDAVFSVKMPGRIIEWVNDSFSLTGYEPEDCIGKTTEFLYPNRSEFLDFGNKLKSAVAAGKDVLHAEQILRRKNGETFPAEITTTVFKEKGQVAQITSIVRDITERRRAEEALRESEEKFRSIFELSPYSTVLLDLKGVIQQCNQQFVRFHATKRGAEAQVGRKISEFFPPEERQKLFNAIEKTIQERKTVVGPIEYVMLREDGSRFPAEGFSIVMEDEHGLPKAVLGLACDITERKKAEEKLLEYQRKLKTMASKILQTEERERHRLAVGLHDDICQKLVLTKLAIESSMKSISDAKLSASLRIACGAIGETIQEADSLTFELSNPILHQFGFIAALEKYLTEEIQQKYGIAYELDSDKRLSTLDDEIKTCLYRVTRELLTNIVRHAHASEVKVFVQKSRGKISVEIQDDGVGFKSTEVSPGKYKTTRFGLFSVREQLEYLGGHLEIESEPGQGTTVTIAVPQKKNAIV